MATLPANKGREGEWEKSSQEKRLEAERWREYERWREIERAENTESERVRENVGVLCETVCVRLERERDKLRKIFCSLSGCVLASPEGSFTTIIKSFILSGQDRRGR